MADSGMSYSKHKGYTKNALRAAEVWNHKLTHLHCYKAQLMVAFGVPMKIIQRFWGWLQGVLGTAYVTSTGNPEALLALGCWRVDKADYHCYDGPMWACWDCAVLQPGSEGISLLTLNLQIKMRSPWNSRCSDGNGGNQQGA